MCHKIILVLSVFIYMNLYSIGAAPHLGKAGWWADRKLFALFIEYEQSKAKDAVK